MSSPPRSQEESDLVMTDASNPSPSSHWEHSPPSVQNHFNKEVGNSHPGMTGGTGKQATGTGHGEPGSGWMTKKFAEEYERICSQLLDQQFSAAKYGDPLLKR